jgi:hypothetical protein
MAAQTDTWLELDLTGEVIAGRLHHADEPPRPFSGWLELVVALDEARDREGRRANANKALASQPGAGHLPSAPQPAPPSTTSASTTPPDPS